MCLCPTKMELDLNDSTLCVKITEPCDVNPCSDHCINTGTDPSDYICVCPHNKLLNDDDQTCGTVSSFVDNEISKYMVSTEYNQTLSDLESDIRDEIAAAGGDPSVAKESTNNDGTIS